MPPLTRSKRSLSDSAPTVVSETAATAKRNGKQKGGPQSKVARKTTKTKQKKPAAAAKQEPSRSLDPNVPWYEIFTKGDEEYNHYMAHEWSFETRGDHALFERLTLEGAQSGLSWLTILRKREAYRRTFYNFDVARVATMTARDVEQILDSTHKDPRSVVVRHRGKIESTIHNAQCILRLQQEQEGEAATQGQENAFDRFLWSFVQNKPILNHFGGGSGGISLSEFPTQTKESQSMSKALKQKGFKFVGPTTCYALMQAVGMVIDHPVGTNEWILAKKRLEQRKEGYQDVKPTTDE